MLLCYYITILLYDYITILLYYYYYCYYYCYYDYYYDYYYYYCTRAHTQVRMCGHRVSGLGRDEGLWWVGVDVI